MKLGILVVYLVSENDAPLLALHLAQIQKYTTVPFTIYGGAPRLAPQLRDQLASYPTVQLPALASTDLRNAAEHSHYLEQLARFAVEDGATHLVTLHSDSFPIRARWVEQLDTALGDSKALATVSFGPYTACLFFRRDFYTQHQPRLLISDVEIASELYREFARKVKYIPHSGAGYLFKAFATGRSWHTLSACNQGVAFGNVYDGIIFHLHGVARLEGSEAERNAQLPSSVIPWLEQTRRWIRRVIPRRWRQFAWEHFGDQLQSIDWLALRHSKKRLLDDPESYFKHFQSEK